MSSVIFSGSEVKALMPVLDLNGNSKILSGSVTPTSSAVSAPIGSLYLNTSTGIVYRKTDSGSSTNWSELAIVGGNLAFTAAKTANYTLSGSDTLVTGDSSGGAFQFTLPTAAGVAGKEYQILKDSSDLNIITIQAAGAELVGPANTTTLDTKGEKLHIYSNGTDWKILSRHIPSVPVLYTPAILGFGTVTIDAFNWQRVGNFVEVQGRFTCGTNTAVEARIPLPGSKTIDSTYIPGNNHMGTWTFNQFSTTNINTTVNGEGGRAYATMGYQNDLTQPFTPILGNSTIPNGSTVCIKFRAPVTGWKA